MNIFRFDLKDFFTLIKGTSLQALGSVFGAAFIVMARSEFGDDRFSDLAIILNLVALCTVLSKFGLDQVILKSGDVKKTSKVVLNAAILILAISFIPLAIYTNSVIVGSIVIFASLTKVLLDIVAVKKQSAGSAILAIALRNVLIPSISLGLMLLGLGFVDPPVFVLVVYLFPGVIFLWKSTITSWSLTDLRAHMVNNFSIFLIYLVPFLTRNIDLILFKNLLSNTELSEVAIMTKLANIFLMIGVSSAAVFSHRINEGRIWHHTLRSLKLLFLIMVPMYLAIILFRQYILNQFDLTMDVTLILYLSIGLVSSLIAVSGYAMVKLERSNILAAIDILVLFISYVALWYFVDLNVFLLVQLILMLMRLIVIYSLVYRYSR